MTAYQPHPFGRHTAASQRLRRRRAGRCDRARTRRSGPISRAGSGSRSRPACATRASSRSTRRRSSRRCPEDLKALGAAARVLRQAGGRGELLRPVRRPARAVRRRRHRASCSRRRGPTARAKVFSRRVREAAERHGGTQIHMHTLQTPVQKAYADPAHGQADHVLARRARHGRRNVTYGHCIHVTEPEIELIGARGASVTNHPSCNFIMRNGITPVMRMRSARASTSRWGWTTRRSTTTRTRSWSCA